MKETTMTNKPSFGIAWGWTWRVALSALIIVVITEVSLAIYREYQVGQAREALAQKMAVDAKRDALAAKDAEVQAKEEALAASHAEEIRRAKQLAQDKLEAEQKKQRDKAWAAKQEILSGHAHTWTFVQGGQIAAMWVKVAPDGNAILVQSQNGLCRLEYANLCASDKYLAHIMEDSSN